MSDVRMRIAKELLFVAKELAAFWDLNIVPPTRSDIEKSKSVVKSALQKKGMRCDKLEFQRYMVYQENKDCSGQECQRNSNKHLCVFGYSDKNGQFGGGVAGGRIGENNQPKLYQDWGIVGEGADGERRIRALIDAYIRKKTTQSDGYSEVKVASVAVSADNKADVEYKMKQQAIKKSLEFLEKKLREHAAHQSKGYTDWGYVGDLEKVLGNLNEINRFLG